MEEPTPSRDRSTGQGADGDATHAASAGLPPAGEETLSRRQRWRLLLGEAAAPPPTGDPAAAALPADWAEAERVAADLYEDERRGGMARSSARLTRWLGELRAHYPPEAVTLMQRDAIERFELTQLLAEPEILETLEPDVHLAATLLQLGKLLPERARAVAERVVAEIARRLARRLEEPLLRAVRSALASGELRRSGRPDRHTDWGRTVLANLKHFQPELGTVVPERFVNRVARGRGLRNVHVLIDQSASMATSAIHAAIAACVLARLPALRVRLLAFDTELADLSDHLPDPVATLFGVQLGGGTDINRALRYEEQYVAEPRRSLVVLISDL